MTATTSPITEAARYTADADEQQREGVGERRLEDIRDLISSPRLTPTIAGMPDEQRGAPVDVAERPVGEPSPNVAVKMMAASDVAVATFAS